MKKKVLESENNNDFKLFNLDISQMSLIIANIIPIIGVLFLNWSIINILIIYFVESIIVAKISIIKISLLKKTKYPKLTIIFSLLFPFIIVYAIFFGFISDFLYKGNVNLIIILYNIILNGIILSISHFISFIMKFIVKKEFDNENQIAAKIAYRWFFIFIVLLASFPFMIFNLLNNKTFIIIFIVLKISIDLYSHNKEHNTPMFKKQDKIFSKVV